MIKKEHIEDRLHAVEAFVTDYQVKDELRKSLQSIGDLERIVGRIALNRAHLYDYSALVKALSVIPAIKNILARKEQISLFNSLIAKMADFKKLEELLISALNDDTGKDWLIKYGFDNELDRLRKLVEHGSQAVLALEAGEQKRTGINSLKIRYNQVHGYGIEVTQPNLHLVPSDYLRTQTLANRERFTTQELKNLEHDLHRARTEITHVEKEVFERVKKYVEQYVPALKKLAYTLAYTDALCALAHTAYMQRYVRPTFNDDHVIEIQNGRHPVVEVRLQTQFIPNSVCLSDDESLWLITGPNMGGKSTFLRQVALISLMAQMGSFVPAAKAHLSIVDRIFTRIGAADNLEAGKSTFLVEMEETALICTQATRHSLVILDEVGRGTSTFDGLAIAQAVVEYIYTHIKAHCLFATHYHELTALCEQFSGIKPYHAAASTAASTSQAPGRPTGGVVLLHKILPGTADGSFGLEVAALAQLPAPLIFRAQEILAQLSITKHHSACENHELYPAAPLETRQEITGIKQYEREQLIAAEIASIDCESLTAKQALDFVWRLKEKLGDKL